jgi:4-amino-4-deoxy-L-arabinose transferase-like glycosyltransferase
MQRKKVLVYLGIIAFSALFLMPFLGSVHLFDSDETNYAESAREMIVTGDYMTVQIDYQPFPEKPPLFFWLQVASMKIFGINEFAARFPNVICGILSLVILYLLGSRLYGHRFGLLWILSYGAAILPFFYFKSGMIDPWFNLFTFLGIAMFIFYLDPDHVKRRLWSLLLSAFSLGLAVLTKGPVAVLVFLLVFLIYLVMHRFRLSTRVHHVILFILVLAITGGSWYFYQLLQGNIDFLQDFIRYHIDLFATQSSFHRGFFGYHLVVLFLGMGKMDRQEAGDRRMAGDPDHSGGPGACGCSDPFSVAHQTL